MKDELLPRLLAMACASVAPWPSAAARAGEPEHAWWVEARPRTCEQWAAPLARQIRLACDAMGHACSIAPNKDRADRRAVLACELDEDRWILEAREADGARLWSVELTGDPTARLRKAGIWAANAGGDVPARTTPDVVAPPPARVFLLPARSDAHADDASASVGSPAAQSSGRGGLAIAGRGMMGNGVHNADEATLYGGRLLAAVRPFAPGSVAAPISIGASFYGGRTVSMVDEVYLGTAGLAVGWGAPWTDGVFGASAEAGVALMDASRYFASRERQALPYASASVIAQVPDWSLRPFAAASVLQFSDKTLGPATTGTLDLGLAWSAW